MIKVSKSDIIEAEGKNDLHYALLGFAQHKVVNADAAQEEADKSDHNLILAVEILTVGACLLNGNTAAETNICLRINCITAVGTKSVSVTGLNAALQADGLIVVHCFAAISTKHSITSKDKIVPCTLKTVYHNEKTLSTKKTYFFHKMTRLDTQWTKKPRPIKPRST